MHANAFLHKLLGSALHKSRINTLAVMVDGVIKSKSLKLTTVGRALMIKGQERSGIQRIDRLLSNRFYQCNSHLIYQQIISRVLSSQQRPTIIVDWSKLPNSPHQVLRASLAAKGRSITLYEVVHHKTHVGNAQVHRYFLQTLSQLLPATCCPIIITDAGFKNPWFRDVINVGWDYIGRVRGKTHYRECNQPYQEIKGLFALATKTPNYLGQYTLTRKNPLRTAFYVVKQARIGRKKYNKNGTLAKNKDAKNYSRSYREPWLLVSSIAEPEKAKRIVSYYKQRMTIEEGFRDLKSTQYGFSLDTNKTRRTERLTVWLLLAALASLFAWMVGYVAEKKELQRQFQANTIRHRRVLSLFYLGCQVIRKKITVTIPTRSSCFFEEDYTV